MAPVKLLRELAAPSRTPCVVGDRRQRQMCIRDRKEREKRKKKCAGSGEADADQCSKAAEESGENEMRRGKLCGKTRQNPALRTRNRGSKDKNGNADHLWRPAVPEFRIERPGALHQALRERIERNDEQYRQNKAFP